MEIARLLVTQPRTNKIDQITFRNKSLAQSDLDINTIEGIVCHGIFRDAEGVMRYTIKIFTKYFYI